MYAYPRTVSVLSGLLNVPPLATSADSGAIAWVPLWPAVLRALGVCTLASRFPCDVQGVFVRRGAGGGGDGGSSQPS